MRSSLSLLAAALVAIPVTARPAAAQSSDPVPVGGPALSLEEAIGIARRSNPAYLQSVDTRDRAGAQLRTAYGAFVPNVNSSLTSGYRQGRQQFVNGVPFGATSDILSSSYDISASLSVNRGTLLGPRIERANAEAVELDIVASGQNLRTNVTQQYVAVLQQQARAALQDTLVATAQAQLDLARVRASVGSATPLDVQRAEVGVGQQRVAVLQARNNVEVEKLRLFQMLGVEQPDGVQLTSRFQVEQPELSLDQLLRMAQDQNPSMGALRMRDQQAGLGVKRARGEYMPTLTLRTGIGGATSQYLEDNFLVDRELRNRQAGCQQENAIRELVGMAPDPTACASISLSPDEVSRLRSANRAFPFDFSTDPWTMSATLSLPIYNGMNREQRVQEAQIQRNDARHRMRALELQLTADVTAAYRTLQTAFQTVQLQEQNSRTAREALSLSEERYRVGAGTFLDVSQARDDYARAETDRINAIYEFHRAYAVLEGAVGRPLR